MRALVSLLVLGCAACALGASACGRAKGDPAAQAAAEKLVGGKPQVRPIDVARAARDPAELARALALPHGDSAARLGAHRFRGTHALRVTENGAVLEALDEQSEIDFAAAGDCHALYTNSRDYGRELTFVAGSGGTVWVRPRYGKFHRRPPTSPEEPRQVLGEIYGNLGADFELVAHAATVADGGPVDAGGRPARKVILGVGPARPRPPAGAPEKAWRDGVTVQALSGEITLDAATGAVLAGRLSARLAFVHKGRSLEMTLDSTHAVTPAADVAITPPPPELSTTTPARSPELRDREDLLQGIAAPGARADAPTDPKAAGSKGRKRKQDEPAPP